MEYLLQLYETLLTQLGSLMNGDLLERAKEAKEVLYAAILAVNEFVRTHTSMSVQEEILFYKTWRPKFYSQLIFFRRLIRLEARKKNLGRERFKEWLGSEILIIENYGLSKKEFYDYYWTGETYLDAQYFSSIAPLDEEAMERGLSEAMFKSHQVSRFLANSLFLQRIQRELDRVDRGDIDSLPVPDHGLVFTGKKADLVELCTLLEGAGWFNNGAASEKQIVSWLSTSLNVDLTNSRIIKEQNFARKKGAFFLPKTFSDIAKRKEQERD